MKRAEIVESGTTMSGTTMSLHDAERITSADLKFPFHCLVELARAPKFLLELGSICQVRFEGAP